jgi:solute carrier family 8 (sodium/calcium exchanger)
LDEDFPGTLGFEVTNITCNNKQKEVEVKVIRSEGADGIIQCQVQTSDFADNKLKNAIGYENYIPKHEKLKFLHGETEKIVKIELMQKQDVDVDGGTIKKDTQESDSGEIEELMFNIKITDPQPSEVKISKKNVCMVTISNDNGTVNMIEEQKKLLEYYLAQKEENWGTQFKKAVMLGPQIDEDNMIIDDVSLYEAIIHFVSITWKILFATVPPNSIWQGKLSFAVALSYIGICTAVVEQFASLLGCAAGIQDAITAITLVALGTSLPDTFASMTAAKNSDNADSAIGNITGSNSVNVFLGLGLPWVIATHYWDKNFGKPYEVPAGNLALSVMIFLIVAVICFMILIARRCVSILLLY